MIKIILIRHGKTLGNTQGKYIGAGTDESLCAEGKEEVKGRIYPETELVYISPMKRCRQTADLIYPEAEKLEAPLLKECDFGIFENKNYRELSGEPLYQKWIDSNGTLPFPGGESGETFRKRCCRGFLQCIEDAKKRGRKEIAFVVHGGTIMSILWGFATPKGEYFKWKLDNGEYYQVILERELWQKEKRFSLVEKGMEENV